MGAVYLGENLKIESKVAIKILHPVHGVDSSMVQRFMGEARAVNRVGHPGIVQIHDFGDEESVGSYLVMEFLEGRSLRDEIKACGRLPAMEVANIISQAAAALGEVHHKGIIHRDLKPDNMFLVPDPALPGGTRVKILDFGIAKLTEDSPNMGSSTMTGVVFGSPNYMSHEQCCDTKNVDLRTDIYALGVIGYELLCGKLPYKADSLGDLVRKQLTEVPPPPSLGDDEATVGWEALDRVVLKALSVQADERFASMNDLVTAIHLALDGVPPEALNEGQGADVPEPREVEVGSRTSAMSVKPQIRLSEMATVPPRGRIEPKPKKSTTPGVGAVGSAREGQESDEMTAVALKVPLVDSSVAGSLKAARLMSPAEHKSGSKAVPVVVAAVLLALGAWGVSRVVASRAEQKPQDPPAPAAVAPDPQPATVAARPQPKPAAVEAVTPSGQPGGATAKESPPVRAAKKRQGTRKAGRARRTAGSSRHKQKTAAIRTSAPIKASPAAPEPVEQPFRSLGGPTGQKPAPADTPFDSLGPAKKQPGSKSK